MKTSIKGIILSIINFLSGGTSDNVDIVKDVTPPKEPTSIVEEYNEEEQIETGNIVYDYKTNSAIEKNKTSDETKIFNFEEAKEIFGVALAADLSQCNGEIDIEKLNDELHLVGVIIRSHYIDGSTFTEDSNFEENIKNCASIGMPTSIYFIPRLTQDEEEIKNEVNILIGRIKEVEMKYGIKIASVSIDYEEKEHVENAQKSAKSIALINKLLKEQGLTAIIYSSSSYIKDLKNVAKENNIIDILTMPIWEASYLNDNCYAVTSSPRPIQDTINNRGTASDVNAVAHQFTDAAYAGAFTTKSLGDPSDSIIDLSEVINPNILFSINAQSKNNPELIGYIVSEGETVSEICETYGITIEEFKAYNPKITDINYIKEGQMVDIPRAKVEELIQKQIESSKKTDIEVEGPNVVGTILFIGGAGLSLYTIINLKKKKEENKNKNKNNKSHSGSSSNNKRPVKNTYRHNPQHYNPNNRTNYNYKKGNKSR